MKLAINGSGKEIEAGADAPKTATCPFCKGIVVLRSRRRSKQPGDVTYFWRHKDQAKSSCPARTKYVWQINRTAIEK